MCCLWRGLQKRRGDSTWQKVLKFQLDALNIQCILWRTGEKKQVFLRYTWIGYALVWRIRWQLVMSLAHQKLKWSMSSGSLNVGLSLIKLSYSLWVCASSLYIKHSAYNWFINLVSLGWILVVLLSSWCFLPKYPFFFFFFFLKLLRRHSVMGELQC